jgi:peptidoglycan hydrolase-like protein with peptidoglycan-binding domain
VTTYRIERSDDTPTASIPVPNATRRRQLSRLPEPRAVAETVAVPAADPVLTQIQTILAARGFTRVRSTA